MVCRDGFSVLWICLAPGFSKAGVYGSQRRFGQIGTRIDADERLWRQIGARLTVVQARGYSRAAARVSSGDLWIAPSPNIPTLETAYVYAGMVLVEGTNLSEGRGTTRPFRLIGAPWMDGDIVAREIDKLGLQGCRFRGAVFSPWFSKYHGEQCGAVLTSRQAR